MKSIYIAGGSPGNKAVNVLKELLEARGHRVTREAQDPLGWDVTLRWGVSYKGEKPAINAGVNLFDKLEALEQFFLNGVKGPMATKYWQDISEMSLPCLARKIHHTKGKDIKVCKTLKEVQRVIRRGSHDFFTPWIPTKTEYRVFTLFDKVFAVYEKVFKGEGEYEGYSRNQRFGFKFVKDDSLLENEGLVDVAINATKALGMDFGGVDVLLGKDGVYYALEVNSMPDIESVKKSSAIRMATRISKWAERI